MQFQLYSQLLKLDLSNDDLLQMYYVLYYDLKEEDKDMADNIARLIEIREKAKIELRKLLFNIKNSIQTSAVGAAVLNFLPVFLKLDYLARNTFNNLNLKVCYEKEKKNIKLYYQTLYNQDIPSATLDVLFKHKKKLESLP
ncbi:hypothetical protein JRG66_03630 [Salinimicrobium tongyeongense]|jgi:hypothetical protein|uniref:Uncharacterized protein n=1 Tax=Salinimicrobium tongyeongense TaxID=2809707 RepID=A0ABY6NSU2_9FLAO|nr:hypothetical protein [Salinimicrobium tongyeongense]UZH55977.1 hypothetical protein JRG66_03630 [Salinimicrobium tongyeongense]